MDVLWSPWEATGPGGRLTELATAECLELLATETVGRVVYCDHRGPLAVPVNYALEDGTILVRTTRGSLAEHLREASTCAFEVDRLDRHLRSGWSVLARGSAAVVRHPASTSPSSSSPGRSSRARPVPWVGGVRSLLIRITPTEVTGRRISAGAPVRGGA